MRELPAPQQPGYVYVGDLLLHSPRGESVVWARQTQNTAIIVADVRRIAHVINTDGVLGTHSALAPRPPHGVASPVVGRIAARSKTTKV